MRFIPALLWAGLIFWVSSQPYLPQAPFLFEGIDKLFHAGEYAIFAMLVLFGDRWPRSPRVWWWVVLLAAFAATDEYHQGFVPHRAADTLDWLADSAGVVMTVALWVKVRGRKLGKWLQRRAERDSSPTVAS